MARLSLMLCGFLLLLQQLSGAAQAEGGKELFKKQCAGCHSIGGGDGAGPDLKGVGAGTPGTPQTRRAELAPMPELISNGKAFFTGKRRFAKGGAPCVSCHTLRYPGVYGGALAGDLTKVYATLGESGVRAVLGSLTFPVMRRVYADRPLSEQEKESLVALFRDSSTSTRPACNPYPAAGVGCFVVFIAVAALLKRRIR
jgi:mono/diheme cytochrome c family protein